VVVMGMAIVVEWICNIWQEWVRSVMTSVLLSV
jgi:hypothetical protein